MELQDYLHFYLGCQVVTNLGTGTLLQVSDLSLNEPPYKVGFDFDIPEGAEVEWCSPILKPATLLRNTPDGEICLNQKGVGGRVKWMCDNGYDAFGLIEAELAVPNE